MHAADPALAQQGLAAFEQGKLIQGVLPADALRHLYITWTQDFAKLFAFYTDEPGYWQAFNERYGTLPSPFVGAKYPAGFGQADNGLLGIDCLLCHAGRHQDQTLIGLSNNRLDLRALVEDLKALPAAIAQLKQANLPAPYDALVNAVPDTTVPEPFASLEVPTGAAGLNDGFGLGLATAAARNAAPAGLRTFMGYQDAAPWWTRAYKERIYSDGAAHTENIYTMMSTLVAFGLRREDLAGYAPTFEAMRHAMCEMKAPRWADSGLPAIDTQLAGMGHQLFQARCVACHGDYDGGNFPNQILKPAEIATDPLRVDQFGATEVDYFNSFIPPGKAQMTDSDGYLAPALTGVWASAPYLHNGSVPTLRAVLSPARRPQFWRRLDGYDELDVGLKFEQLSAGSDRETAQGRKVVDTTHPGLSNSGHDVASDLTEQQLTALLEYLKTL